MLTEALVSLQTGAAQNLSQWGNVANLSADASAVNENN